MQVFISWSGDYSRSVAQALNDWLPAVIQGVEPWISTKDIEKGREWWAQIKQQLAISSYGLICVTPENVDSPWLNFEAGALLANQSSPPIATFVFGLEPRDISGPLGIFQGTKYEKDDIWLLVKQINNRREVGKIFEATLQKTFQLAFLALKKQLDALLRKMTEDNKKAGHGKTQLEEQQVDSSQHPLDSEEIEILRFFGINSGDITVGTISTMLKMNEHKVKFYLIELERKGLLDLIGNYVTGFNWELCYGLKILPNARGKAVSYPARLCEVSVGFFLMSDKQLC